MQLMDSKKQGIDIQENILSGRLTFTRTGESAQCLAFSKNLDELEILVETVKTNNLPLTVIGNASNLITRDGGISGLVLILTKMDETVANQEEATVTADAGARIIDTSEAACEAGLSGLEPVVGIPDSVGGTVFMNAGAYGGETELVTKSVRVLTCKGEFKAYTYDKMEFGYRHPLVQETGDIVISITFGLEPGDKWVIKAKMEHFNGLRRAKQPLEYPSCGSAFKRPAGRFAGPVMIKAGLQEKKTGGAEDSMKRADFTINVGGAIATDYLDLIHLTQKTIRKDFDVDLQIEVRIIGKERD